MITHSAQHNNELDDFGTSEMTEWDDNGNVIHRIWQPGPDRCEYCGAWTDDPESVHMLSCPHHPANVVQPVIDPLSARTVKERYDDGVVIKKFSPVPMSVIQPRLSSLKAQGYKAEFAGTETCAKCGCTSVIDMVYATPGGSGESVFDICPDCWHVWETIISEEKEEQSPAALLQHAVIDHLKKSSGEIPRMGKIVFAGKQKAQKRIAAAFRAISGKGTNRRGSRSNRVRGLYAR